MKNSIKPIPFFLVLVLLVQTGILNAQEEYVISGLLLDQDKKPVMFANVALLSFKDSSLLAGTVSDNTGEFKLKYNKKGRYIFFASFMGYLPYQEIIELSGKLRIERNPIVMQAKQTKLNEVVIAKERMKAKQEVDKTSYYVNSYLRSTSNSGIDIIKQVPGIQVDLFQNVSMGGSENILILVNGIEKDADFLARIHPDKIDRVEVVNTPGAEYDAKISGLINIVLKENRNRGISGHVYANIPTAGNEVFSFPSASLDYSFDKLTLYTSYNGAFSYFDIEALDTRKFHTESSIEEIIKKEDRFQKNWSHKMHVGMDYFINKNNQLNLYGFISRFSNNHTGNFCLSTLNESSAEQLMKYDKDDRDLNNSAYASAFFKHIFKPGAELSIESSYYRLVSDNIIQLTDLYEEKAVFNHTMPSRQLLNSRLNFHINLNEYIGMKTGIEQKLGYSEDELVPAFTHRESSSAAYLTLIYTKNKWQVTTGLRAEYQEFGTSENEYTDLYVLPSFNIKYSMEKGKNLKLSYRAGTTSPTVFQLNPSVLPADRYATWQGNPDLKSEINHSLKLDYGMLFGNNYLKTGLFYTFDRDVLESLTALKQEYFLEKEIHNAGNMRKYGMETSGSLKLHKNISINPLFRIYGVHTHSHDIAMNYRIEDRKALNFESALSMMFIMKHDFALSFSLQYNSRRTCIQGDYREDPLYFLSLQKKLFDKLKIGVTSAIPFRKSFTYQSYDIRGEDFSQLSGDNIQMSLFPVWIKLNYSFASGKNTRRIEGAGSFKENRNKKGF